MKKSTLILIGGYAIGLVAVGVLVILALPLIAVGDWRPFEQPWVRWLIVVLTSLIALGYLGYTLYQRAQRARELTAGMAAGSNESKSQNDVRNLEAGMKDALATLKRSTGRKGDHLYDLPWYIIIGPPGSGKTTALAESGLKFPLASGASAPKIKGVGGTRYCDWWFAEDAVLIDTAGRYTTQDSDASVDSQSWLAFLKLLQRTRPKQPINGALVCVSIEDLLSLSPLEVENHTVAIRKRLAELHDTLKIDFPVYAVFTKADLLAGFIEFFGHLPEQRRRAVWGSTFQTTDKTANMVGEIPKEMDALIARLNQAVVDRLQDEPNPTARVQIFGFPSQVASLKQPVFEFLSRIFEPTRYHSNAVLRGFYFTSGTQDGTPIDQLIGALARSFGAQRAGGAQQRSQGRSFFLGKLLTDVVFGEAGWVSTNPAAVRRGLILKTGAYALLALVCVGLAGAWSVSYGQNSGLIGKVHDFVANFGRQNGLLTTEPKIADRDFTRVLPALIALETMPAGYDERSKSIDMSETFGLSQRSRLNGSADTSYERALHRLFLPRLMFRMEERLRENLANPGVVVEALPVYLILGGGDVAMDKARVIRWWTDDWSQQLYPGAANDGLRQNLNRQLENMLELHAPVGLDSVKVDPALVLAAQAAVARMPVVDRAFELLRADSRRNSGADWSLRAKAGQDAALVFEGVNGVELDKISVPFLFTYAGFHQYFLANVAQVARRVQDEQVFLGDMARQPGLASQYASLQKDLLERYRLEFANAWNTALGQLRIRPLTADKPRYESLQAAAAPTSPITALIESIRDETQLSRERPVPPQADGKPAAIASTLASPFSKEDIARVEPEKLRSLYPMTQGALGQRPLDQLRLGLGSVYLALTVLNDPTRTAEGQGKFRDSLSSLQSTANLVPEPFKSMIQTSVGAFDNDATATTVARLKQRLATEVTSVCEQAITNRYPFRKTGTDMSIQDFQKLFGPNGTINSFYTLELLKLIDTSKATWAWNSASPVARGMSLALVRDLQRADDIRSAFFAQGSGFAFKVKSLMIGDTIASARLEIDADIMTAQKPGSPAGVANQPQVGSFQWPGFGVGGASLTFDPPGGDPPPMSGPWAPFRLLDAATLTLPRAAYDPVVARFGAGDRQAQYQFSVNTQFNPFNLAALREFHCPTP